MTLLNTIKDLFTPQPVEVVAEDPLTEDEQRFLEIMSRRKKDQPDGEENK